MECLKVTKLGNNSILGSLERAFLEKNIRFLHREFFMNKDGRKTGKQVRICRQLKRSRNFNYPYLPLECGDKLLIFKNSCFLYSLQFQYAFYIKLNTYLPSYRV